MTQYILHHHHTMNLPCPVSGVSFLVLLCGLHFMAMPMQLDEHHIFTCTFTFKMADISARRSIGTKDSQWFQDKTMTRSLSWHFFKKRWDYPQLSSRNVTLFPTICFHNWFPTAFFVCPTTSFFNKTFTYHLNFKKKGACEFLKIAQPNIDKNKFVLTSHLFFLSFL